VSRRTRNRQDRLNQALEKVRRRYDKGPLSCVSAELLDFAQGVHEGVHAGQIEQERANKLADYLEGVIERLPQSFGDRFRFDAAMLSAFADEWKGGGTQLSPMILPRPSPEWGHLSVAMPMFKDQSAHVIDLVLIPGDDDISDIDLLTYPFMVHELGHNALFRYETIFGQDFEKELDQHVNNLIRQSLADKGTARSKADEIIENTRRMWSPTPNHKNWAYEIAADIIALWTCGPAYLAAFHDVLDDSGINPYQIGHGHPPYEARASALIHTANQLGWNGKFHRLNFILRDWARSGWKSQKNNQYAALATKSLINAAADCAFKACYTLGLPKCTFEDVQAVQEKLRNDVSPELGSELVLAAYLVRDCSEEAAYEKWERKVIGIHLPDITL
jgi:hypothetical protein